MDKVRHDESPFWRTNPRHGSRRDQPILKGREENSSPRFFLGPILPALFGSVPAHQLCRDRRLFAAALRVTRASHGRYDREATPPPD